MNSKLEQILHELYVHGYNTASRHKPKAQDIAVDEAKKAIRQAVGEEMLELVEHPHQILIQIDDIEYLNGGYVSRAELRQKIKEWQGGEE